MILEHVHQPHHRPVDLSLLINLACKELDQFEEEHLWHVKDYERDACSWDTLVNGLSDLELVKSESEH